MEKYLHEQQVYDEAVAILESASAQNEAERPVFQSFKLTRRKPRNAEKIQYVTADAYSTLLVEYGKLLHQLKRNSVDYVHVQQNIYFDPLTGLFNSKYLVENLDRILHTMPPDGAALSLAIIEIDYLEEFYTKYGSKIGDECVVSVANTLKSCLYRGRDFVAHISSGKFAIVLPHTKKEGSRLVASRILQLVAGLNLKHEASPAAEHITVSVGVATGMRHRSNWTADAFLLCANESLGMAKNYGRNRYVYQPVRT